MILVGYDTRITAREDSLNNVQVRLKDDDKDSYYDDPWGLPDQYDYGIDEIILDSPQGGYEGYYDYLDVVVNYGAYEYPQTIIELANGADPLVDLIPNFVKLVPASMSAVQGGRVPDAANNDNDFWVDATCYITQTTPPAVIVPIVRDPRAWEVFNPQVDPVVKDLNGSSTHSSIRAFFNFNAYPGDSLDPQLGAVLFGGDITNPNYVLYGIERPGVMRLTQLDRGDEIIYPGLTYDGEVMGVFIPDMTKTVTVLGVNDDLDYFWDEDCDTCIEGQFDPGVDEVWRWGRLRLDNDGDGFTDEDPPWGIDNDGDGLTDEDPWTPIDNDQDGLTDEDFVGDMNGDGAPGVVDVDDDGDGLTDEDSQGLQPGEEGYLGDTADDDDEDGLVDEDDREMDRLLQVDLDGDGQGGEDDPNDDAESWLTNGRDDDGDGFTDEADEYDPNIDEDSEEWGYRNYYPGLDGEISDATEPGDNLTLLLEQVALDEEELDGRDDDGDGLTDEDCNSSPMTALIDEDNYDYFVDSHVVTSGTNQSDMMFNPYEDQYYIDRNINGVFDKATDDDNDGLTDEDPPGDLNGDGLPGVAGVDDDGDGLY